MAIEMTPTDKAEKKENVGPLQEYEAMKLARLMSIRESKWSTIGALAKVKKNKVARARKKRAGLKAGGED